MTMSDEPQSPDSPDLEQRLRKVYEDRLVTSAEFQRLRDDADQVFSQLKSRFPANQNLQSFQALADQTVEAMQRSILDIKKQKPDAADKQWVRQGFGFQIAYIKACLDRFTQSI